MTIRPSCWARGVFPAVGASLVLTALGASAQTYVVPEDGEDVIGELTYQVARYEDTLLEIGRRFNAGYEELRLANPTVDTFLPGEGTRVLIPSRFVLPDAPRQGLVLNLPEMRLYAYPEPGADDPPKVVTHPVSIGRVGWETPRGLTRVAAKLKDPAWFPPASIRAEHAANGTPLPARVPPGPDNPLGRHALRLGWSQYLIHGTNKPNGVGMRVSHGCIRMFPEDIEALYAVVPVGTPVRVVNQPVKVGWSGTELYLEAHPAAAELALDGEPDVTEAVRRIIDAAPVGAMVSVDWAAVERVSTERRGIPRVVGHRSDPTLTTAAPPAGDATARAEGTDVESLW